SLQRLHRDSSSFGFFGFYRLSHWRFHGLEWIDHFHKPHLFRSGRAVRERYPVLGLRLNGRRDPHWDGIQRDDDL
ncbi:MAG: hypothetical protein KC994_04070, partial [Candidatus Omnitrophica bacterium]|nr:hypothetical protein [Candidatus Omnitrophota bacterium]